MTNKILDDREVSEVQKFLKSKTMLQAVKKVLLAGLFDNGTIKPGEDVDFTRNFAIQQAMFAIQANPEVSDADLGQNLRANVAALRLIDLGFQELSKYAPTETTAEEKNPAR